jgi:hypothetical protein
MSGPTLQDLMAAVESLRGEMGAMRAELDALKADVERLDGHGADQLDPDTLAMLAATVTSYLGKRVRVRSAREVTAAREGAPAWARHGRAAIQTSHRLHRGP